MLQPNLFIDKDNFDLNPVVVLRNTRKEKDKEKDKEKEREKDRDKDRDKDGRDRDRDRDREKDRDRDNHDKPTSSLLSLDAFRLNWTGSNDESVTAGPAGTCNGVRTVYVQCV